MGGDSDDEVGSGSESSGGFLSPSEGEDSGSEAEEPQPQAKKRRVDGSESLGLELVTGALHHGGCGAPAATAAHIDASEEAAASLMQLEVEELLKEARPDHGLEAALLELVRSLAALLRALPDAEVAPDAREAAAVRGFLSDLAFQPVRPFVFRAPTRVQVVGSFGLRAALRPSPCLDLSLLMPAACFDSKDQLNHRYFAKRALYLAHVAAALRGHPQLSGVGWECLADDPRRPALVLHPRQTPGGFCIRLLPAAPPELCPLPRLAPDRNNLRRRQQQQQQTARSAAWPAKQARVARAARRPRVPREASSRSSPTGRGRWRWQQRRRRSRRSRGCCPRRTTTPRYCRTC